MGRKRQREEKSENSNNKRRRFHKPNRIDAPLPKPNDLQIIPKRDNVNLYNFEATAVQEKQQDLEDIEEYKRTHMPSPSAELMRGKLLLQLRAQFETYFESLFNMPAPKECFNRWLFAQFAATVATTNDPFLRRPEIAMETPLFKLLILCNIPFYIKFYNVMQAKVAMETYLARAREWAQKLNVMEKVLPFISKTEQWLQSLNNMYPEDLLPYFEERKKQLLAGCDPVFEEALNPLITQLCSFLVIKSKELISVIAEKVVTNTQHENIFVSFPNEKTCTVTYQDYDTFDITILHYNKLKHLYQLNNSVQDPENINFNKALYTLLRRYQTLAGPSEFEGNLFQASLNESAFQYLHSSLNISHEAFASPMNCYFKQYCSAFFDVDVFFGSRGNFFNFEPEEGCFQVCPPFTFEVLEFAAEYCVQLIKKNNSKPLSFVLFMPEWNLTSYKPLLEEASVKHILLPPKTYEFVSGLQHLVHNAPEGKHERYWRMPFASHMYVLQNDAAKEKWPLTDQIVQDIVAAMK